MVDFYKLCAELGHVSISCARPESLAGKVHFVTRPLNEKASFLVISGPGNWPFFASRQQGAESAITGGFPNRPVASGK
jgi:hypothetical protein